MLWTVKWSESHSVMSDSLWPHVLSSPWYSPGQNTGVGSLPLPQGIFPTQGLNPGLLHCRQILYQLSHKESLLWTVMELSVLFIFFITISVPITRSFEQWPHVIGIEEEKSLNCVRLFATPWTVAYQALQSMGFSRQEYWSGLPLPSPFTRVRHH